MAARGAESKSIITQKILNMFEGSFLYDKEIRIPMTEAGESLQIKCTLTCAKTNVSTENGPTVPNIVNNDTSTTFNSNELTEEEKQNVDNLIKKLGL